MSLLERLGPDLVQIVMEFAECGNAKQRLNSLIRSGWFIRPEPQMVFTLNGPHPLALDYEQSSRVIILW